LIEHILLLIGDFFANQKKYDKAEEYYKNALEINPNYKYAKEKLNAITVYSK